MGVLWSSCVFFYLIHLVLFYGRHYLVSTSAHLAALLCALASRGLVAYHAREDVSQSETKREERKKTLVVRVRTWYEVYIV